MPIRPAQYSDLPVAARVIAASFRTDGLFKILFPQSDQYPEDFVTAHRRSLRAAWWDYSKVLMISYEAVSDPEGLDPEKRTLLTKRAGKQELITGHSEWHRVGLGWEHVWNISWWDPRRLITKAIAFWTKVKYFFRPCRASAQPSQLDPDPLRYTNFISRLIPFSTHLLVFPDKPWRANHWSLEVLGIHPAFQGQGYGKDLVQWGLAKAKCDTAAGVTGLPSVVISADTKEHFYQKVGFDEIVGWSSRNVEGLAAKNPLLECGGGAVLWSHVREDEDLAKKESGVAKTRL